MKLTLPKDFTLDELTTPRGDSERFARNVLGVMSKARKEHGPVSVRFGITGTGQAPNYRIEDADGLPLFAIDGANHQTWPDGERFEGRDTWSTASMSYEDVQSAIGMFAGPKR